MLIKAHFDDCPYGCNPEGKVLDDNTGRMVPCPHCSNRKAELMRSGSVIPEDDTEVKSLAEVLGISDNFLTHHLSYNNVIPERERVFLKPESVSQQQKLIESLYHKISAGRLPESSYCFGITIQGYIDKLAYPLLAKAYLSGLTVGRVFSCSEFSRLTSNLNEDLSDQYISDFLIMVLNAGFNKSERMVAKGLMQTRALKGKPTIFITTSSPEACSELLGFYDEVGYFKAKPSFVIYKRRPNKGRFSKYVQGLLGVDNAFLDGDEHQYDDEITESDDIKHSGTSTVIRSSSPNPYEVSLTDLGRI